MGDVFDTAWYPCERIAHPPGHSPPARYVRLRSRPFFEVEGVIDWLVSVGYVEEGPRTAEGERNLTGWGTRYFACTAEKSEPSDG